MRATVVKSIRLKALAFASACALIIPCASRAQAISTAEIAFAHPPAISALPDAPTPINQQDQSTPPQQTPPASQPQTPPSNQQSNQPSLEDLGITPNQVKGSAQQQALLEKRTHMLKVHQTLGLITVAPMAAALITGPQANAKGKKGQIIREPTDANLDFHIALGGLTTGLYWTSAYYAAFAPRAPGAPKKRGGIRLHEALVWIHGPGMILTPALGIAAYKQENAGEKVHGIASAHGAVAYVTAAAYGASIVAVSWPIHIKF